ncbi:DegV family protein [Deinococcus sp.]|uniref:DegV family protein n=1 Tax=Deinococcus sp. TaxID=47478 RepID=UPI0025C341AA|nr:DegV family protein [Deinococcus sp.]
MTYQFGVATDGGLDAYPTLRNDVPVAPFSLNFGNKTYRTQDLTREELYRELETNPTHPTSSQPSPQEWLEAFRRAEAVSGSKNVLAVTISSGLSGSRNAAEQAASMAPDLRVTIHNSMTLSGAQAFQVHAAQTASENGETLQTALNWMKTISGETELYFTIETLEYLRRGGRIGRVAATLGGLLNLKPVITVDKSSGTYINVGRARSYSGGIEAVLKQVDRQFGQNAPLRAGLLYGSVKEDTDLARTLLEAQHPLLWSGEAGVNPVLNVHTGPRTVGVAAAPGPWPWER